MATRPDPAVLPNNEEFPFTIDIKDKMTGEAVIEVLKKAPAGEEAERVPSKTFFHPHKITGSTALLTVLKGKSGSAAPEALECEMRATVGIGKQNARFIPLSQCSYKYTLDPDEKRQKEVFLTWLNDSKKVSASDLETNENRKGELQREFATMELARCYLEENNEPYSFDFTLESIGVLSPDYILGRALEILQAKCSRYASINVGDLPENLKVTPADARMQGYDFLFVGEDHTLGNLFQTYIEQNLMTEEGDVSFVGYKVPHPLRDEMLLRVGVEKDGQQLTARAAVASAAKGCADLFAKWRAAWGSMS
jgi:DNA-directed RNA polymerase subunit L